VQVPLPQVAPAASWQTGGVTQSPAVQQLALGMHTPPHSLVPVPQLQTPVAVAQVPPLPQSAFTQQPVPVTQEPPQMRCPLGHAHVSA
jgi:hypothetical protein